ncbi:MAG: type II toxin-antitoxin system VapC family toxin [Thiocapsa sp.]|uniref:type II toxin-antitoxin system VapC family toxin n=1 Tax=Thiocapsa sp. TaxID=2024551 RepID=UPI001BCE01FF|nr:type II toxin-antitoxin system VapC family toxin [Thiocapsa sp.]QVL50615.1 MAG: type II toxin-antitoxin system VapC family toxin [Thiocapsa sp.]
MTLLVLDTDHLSLFQRGNTAILPRIRAISPAQIAISIVSVEEMLQGRLAQVRRAGTGEGRIRAYAWLEKTLTFVRAFRVLPFDDQAERRYVDLATRRLRIGAQDLKIAAIALCHDAVLVTRNQRDFGRIAGLELEDWTIE